MSNVPVTNFKVTVESFEMTAGVSSGDIEVDCCLWGGFDKPVIALLGGISANRWALDHDHSAGSGWWRNVFHASSPVNAQDYGILTFEYFSFPERVANPPTITTADQAYILRQIQIYLDLPLFHAVIG
ncbi:MAG: hypothetical protein ACSHWU_10230, partial [Marinicella sp.]